MISYQQIEPNYKAIGEEVIFATSGTGPFYLGIPAGTGFCKIIFESLAKLDNMDQAMGYYYYDLPTSTQIPFWNKTTIILPIKNLAFLRIVVNSYMSPYVNCNVIYYA